MQYFAHHTLEHDQQMSLALWVGLGITVAIITLAALVVYKKGGAK